MYIKKPNSKNKANNEPNMTKTDSIIESIYNNKPEDTRKYPFLNPIHPEKKLMRRKSEIPMRARGRIQQKMIMTTPPSSPTKNGTPDVSHNIKSEQSLRARSGSVAGTLYDFIHSKPNTINITSHTKGTTILSPTIQYDQLKKAPEPTELDDVDSYLLKLAPYGKFIGVILIEKENEFKQNCLYAFLTKNFDFREDALDIALRKLLIFVELPKESQQIDRLLEQFSRAYYNAQKILRPNCWADTHQVYFVAFTLLILYTDYYNPNNKQKMTQEEFVNLIKSDKESKGYLIPKHILEYYYDNTVSKELPKFQIETDRLPFDTGVNDQVENSTEMYSPLQLIREKKIHPVGDVPIRRMTRRKTVSLYFSNIPGATVQDDVDIYSHIFNDTVQNIGMKKYIENLREFHTKLELNIPLCWTCQTFEIITPSRTYEVINADTFDFWDGNSWKENVCLILDKSKLILSGQRSIKTLHESYALPYKTYINMADTDNDIKASQYAVAILKGCNLIGVFNCASNESMVEWVEQINVCSAFNNTNAELEVSTRVHDLLQKNVLLTAKIEKVEKLLKFYEFAVPLSLITRTEVLKVVRHLINKYKVLKVESRICEYFIEIIEELDMKISNFFAPERKCCKSIQLGKLTFWLTELPKYIE